jgi:hypothetical protein
MALQEDFVFSDFRYRCITRSQEIQELRTVVGWQVAIILGKRRALKKSKTVEFALNSNYGDKTYP